MKKDKKRFLQGILKLVNLLKSQDLKRSTIAIYIYNEEFFKGIDPGWFMEASGWMSHNLHLDEEHQGMERDIYKYKKHRNIVYFIYSKDYDQINTIKDIENRVWQD
ncbi:hypothetical protein [Selenihalanaerobacter shriftii]|uniref:Uncharacterized protein n=1 Tax=Selenihalanaerobacter shriftii TaxID=142842 RepID=A0A1T4R8B9_9FIRM|nr:hypothetical protein [Selenihalanaerobacter shriftii]SKA12330.1 hypothetical protein SAMN02745118_02855 [Selenihalanaerobacter shriftii]